MRQQNSTAVGRRQFLWTLGVGASVAVISAVPNSTEAHADTENDVQKRKARYKADSAEVKTYYRVNRYPS